MSKLPIIPFKSKYFDNGGMRLNMKILSKPTIVKKILETKTHLLLDLSDLDDSNSKYVKMFVQMVVRRLKSSKNALYRLFIISDLKTLNKHFKNLNVLGKLFLYYNSGKANMWILPTDDIIQRRSLYIRKGKFESLHMLFEEPFTVMNYHYNILFYNKYLRPKRGKKKVN